MEYKKYLSVVYVCERRTVKYGYWILSASANECTCPRPARATALELRPSTKSRNGCVSASTELRKITIVPDALQSAQSKSQNISKGYNEKSYCWCSRRLRSHILFLFLPSSTIFILSDLLFYESHVSLVVGTSTLTSKIRGSNPGRALIYFSMGA